MLRQVDLFGGSGQDDTSVFRSLDNPVRIRDGAFAEIFCVSPKVSGNTCQSNLRHTLAGVVLYDSGQSAGNEVVSPYAFGQLHLFRVGTMAGMSEDTRLGDAGA